MRRRIITSVVYRPITVAQAVDRFTQDWIYRYKEFPVIVKAEWQKNLFSENDDVLITARVR